MKRGTTPTLEIKLELNATDVTNVYFAFKEKVEDSDEFLLQKNYPEDATYDDEKEVFLLPLTQEDTLKLTDTFFLEAEVVIGGKSVIKSDIGKEIMQPTLYTEVISGNESNGNNETITLSFTDYIKQEGGGSSDYNDLTHKPRFNGIEWVGNKTDSDMGIATKGELQNKADKSDTYTKEETNTFLNAKQDNVSGGSGIKIENDEISIDVESGTFLDFENGKLRLNYGGLAHNTNFRGYLTQTYWNNPLASKSYVDDLMSGATKWEFVSQLPTEDIDIHTIYFVPKESAETDNIYDEWVYAIKSRNPDVYDWELLGTSQVDLSNYYTKSETHALSYDSTYRQALTDTNYSNPLQPRITSNNMLNSNLVDDSGSMTKLFVSATDKQTWDDKADTSDIPTNVSELTNDSGYQTSSDVASAISGKEDKTTISTDTTSTTVTLTLADNHEYRYTQDLTSLTLTMPSGDFISSIVFASGSTPTSMTYDSNIKWSGDDVTNGQFVPTEKTYNIVIWYDGINVNGVVRGV